MRDLVVFITVFVIASLVGVAPVAILSKRLLLFFLSCSKLSVVVAVILFEYFRLACRRLLSSRLANIGQFELSPL